MKICSHCHANNLDNWDRCRRCGTALPAATQGEDAEGDAGEARAAGSHAAHPPARRNRSMPTRNSALLDFLVNQDGQYGVPIYLAILGGSVLLALYATAHEWPAVRAYFHHQPLVGSYVDYTRHQIIETPMDLGFHLWLATVVILAISLVLTVVCARYEDRRGT